MIQDQGPKVWHPIRFTKGGIREVGDEYFGPAVVREHAVIILNNPLENIDLLLDICAKGTHRIMARDIGLVVDLVYQLAASYVQMAERINSKI